MSATTDTSTCDTLRVLRIMEGTSVDGPGLRTSIYFAGCTHHCPGCHNPQSWEPDQGEEFTIPQLLERIDTAGMNVTFSGGDPLYQAPAIIRLAKAIKESTPYTIW